MDLIRLRLHCVAVRRTLEGIGAINTVATACWVLLYRIVVMASPENYGSIGGQSDHTVCHCSPTFSSVRMVDH